MDPLSLTVATLIATKAAEGFGSEIGTKAAVALQSIVKRVRARFAGDAAAEDALTELEAGRQEAGQVETVAGGVDEVIKADDGFRKELLELVAELKADPATGRFVTSISGDAKVGKVVNIGNVTGDVSF
jgi:hypothetical protein